MTPEQNNSNPKAKIQLLRPVDSYPPLPQTVQALSLLYLDRSLEQDKKRGYSTRTVYENQELLVNQIKFESRDTLSGSYRVHDKKTGLLNYKAFYNGNRDQVYVDRTIVQEYDFIEDPEPNYKNEPIIKKTTIFVHEPHAIWAQKGRKTVEQAYLFRSPTFLEGQGWLLSTTHSAYDESAVKIVDSAIEQLSLLPNLEYQIFPNRLLSKNLG